MRRRAWYKSAEYHSEEWQEKTLGDRSKVEFGALREEPGFYMIHRTYPWGFEQKIVYSVLPSGERKYHRQDPGPESPQKEPAKAFEEALQNGEVRVHARGAVPGQGISDTYVHELRRHVTQSAEFEREFAEMNLARTMQSDHSTMHRSSPPGYNGSAGQVEAFDASLGAPPLPGRK